MSGSAMRARADRPGSSSAGIRNDENESESGADDAALACLRRMRLTSALPARPLSIRSVAAGSRRRDIGGQPSAREPKCYEKNGDDIFAPVPLARVSTAPLSSFPPEHFIDGHRVPVVWRAAVEGGKELGCGRGEAPAASAERENAKGRRAESEPERQAETAVVVRLAPKLSCSVPALKAIWHIEPCETARGTVLTPDHRSAVWAAAELPTHGFDTAANELSPDAPIESAPRTPATERPVRPGPLRDLSIEIRQPNQDRVEVRLLQQSGELHVAVRATDAELVRAVRQNLPQLVGGLDGGGHRVEAWRPGGIVTTAVAAAEVQGHAADVLGSDGQPGQNWSQPDRDPRNPHRQNVPLWVADMEGALAGEPGEPDGLTD